jgi:hypothetical protein
MPTLNTTQKVNLTISPQTANSQPATITGVPLWNSNNVATISLVISPDGMSANAIAGQAGIATVSVIANAGTVLSPITITGGIGLQVTPAVATSLILTASTPVSQ